MRKVGITIFALVLLVLGGCAVYAVRIMHSGFSTRTAPSSAEARMAITMRDASVPARYKAMKNPVSITPEAVHEGMAHYADHCAVCHSNNGSGESMLGKMMYPRPPNLAGEETQSMTDGEIYYPIQYGIRLSGMPAFGDPVDNDEDTWKLVAFIRHLPKLTREEEQEMARLNPKSPHEWQEEQEENKFLNGSSPTPVAEAPTTHHHH